MAQPLIRTGIGYMQQLPGFRHGGTQRKMPWHLAALQSVPGSKPFPLSIEETEQGDRRLAGNGCQPEVAVEFRIG
ncbi:hypothetical protein D9M71_770310 [compost metagenome]